jgi:hypothetical protein
MREEPGVLQTSLGGAGGVTTGIACGDARDRSWKMAVAGTLGIGKPDSASPGLLPGFQESPRCREATVTFHLLRLLTRDLRPAAQSGPAVTPPRSAGVHTFSTPLAAVYRPTRFSANWNLGLRSSRPPLAGLRSTCQGQELVALPRPQIPLLGNGRRFLKSCAKFFPPRVK